MVEAQTDKSVRSKAVDELQTVKSSYQKLKDRHEALTSAANAQGGSAADVAIREERTKLLVSVVELRDRPGWSLADGVATHGLSTT